MTSRQFALTRVSLLVGLTALVLACPKPVEPGPDGGMTELDGGGTCTGLVGCACDTNGVCQSGECLGNVCVDCRRGEAACVCRSNGTCNPGLRCTNDRCETCPAQAQGCACGAGDSCNAGLTCTGGTCTPSTCTAGTVPCPCRATDPKCDGTAYCDGMNVCQTCMPDVAGCACGAGNACGAGLTCDTTSMRCRAPVTCAALVMNGACKVNQLCTQASGADAVCVPERCEPEFKWDPRTSACVRCDTPGCANEPSCTGGLDGGLASRCAQDFRQCQSVGTPPIAFCGDCLTGYSLNPNNQRCEPLAQCGTGQCLATEYCDPTGGPHCVVSPCPAGEAQNASGSCESCNITCNLAGQTGQVWPFKAASLSGCICATLQGWFIANGLPKQCDEDGDGWVKEDADSSLDPQLRANARCSIRKADTVELRDELGTGFALRSCDAEGLVPAASNPSCAPLLLRLLETERNDTPGQPNPSRRAPSYGFADAGLPGAGRLLEASELNSITKACVGLAADYNDNKLDDIAEAPVALPTVMPPRSPDRDRLEEFSYFVELHTSSFQANPDGGAGRLIIRELPRCTTGLPGGFPLQYLYNDGGSLPIGGTAQYDSRVPDTYWRNCTRQRDPAYSLGQVGFDLARWNCPADGGPCFVPPPQRTQSAPLNPANELFRQFGVCEVLPSPPADGRWRGMNHHSQFKCVNPTGAALVNPYDVAESRFLPSGDLVMNACAAAPLGDGGTSSSPFIQCVARAGVPQRVGFAAVKYRPYGPPSSGYDLLTPNYRGGCVNEEIETAVLPPMLSTYGTWLCPWPEYDNVFQSDGGMKARSDRAYGRYSCFGDLPNFLWAPEDGGFERATLRLADDAGSPFFGVLR